MGLHFEECGLGFRGRALYLYIRPHAIWVAVRDTRGIPSRINTMQYEWDQLFCVVLGTLKGDMNCIWISLVKESVR